MTMHLGLRVLAVGAVVCATAVGLVSPASAIAPPTTGCAAVETLVVRGSTETPVPPSIAGGEKPLTDAIVAKAAATVNTYGVPYPATLFDPANPGPYNDSMKEGRRALAARLSDRSTSCPDQKFVLMGYSQGAQVVGDALAGNNGGTPEVSSSLGAKVVAVVLYGDPDFVAGEKFDRGTFRAGVNGVNARPKGALSSYADRIASYCQADDIYCQTGVPAGSGGHWVYASTYTDDASDFVVAHLPQPAGSASPQRIIGPGSKCVDVDGDDSGVDLAKVQLWDCQSRAVDQRWTSTGGTLRTLGRCLDIEHNGTGIGAKVELWDCNGVGGQQWVQQANGSLLNPQSGRCLDAPGGVTDNSTRLQIWDCNGSAAQTFRIGGPTITGPAGRCVDVDGYGTGTNLTKVQLWDCNATSADQHWAPVEGTLRTLGRCLDIDGNSTANGTKVQLYDCNGSGGQQWVQADGSLRNPQSGRCLNARDDATSNGTQLEIADCKGTAAQSFRLG